MQEQLVWNIIRDCYNIKSEVPMSDKQRKVVTEIGKLINTQSLAIPQGIASTFRILIKLRFKRFDAKP